MRLPDWEKEKKFLKLQKTVIGLDEAGRGPLAGPVVAVACWLEPDFLNFLNEKKDQVAEIKLVRDSKTLSEKQREKIFYWLGEQPRIHFAIGECSAKEIDRLNILGATMLAMRLAAEDLLEKIAGLIQEEKLVPVLCVDGNRQVPGVDWEQVAIVSGDSQVFSIAAASIWAKVWRDKKMLAYHREYSQYGFARHKGYGTKEHYANLKRFGPCALHRKSFRLE